MLKLSDMVLECRKSAEAATGCVLVLTLKSFIGYQKEADREIKVTAHSPQNLFKLDFGLAWVSPFSYGVEACLKTLPQNPSNNDNTIFIRIDLDRRDELLFLKTNQKGEGVVDVKDMRLRRRSIIRRRGRSADSKGLRIGENREKYAERPAQRLYISPGSGNGA